MNDASVLGTFVAGGIFIGLAVWLFAKWYYTKDGKAKLQAQEDELKAEVADLKARAAAKGVHLP